MSFSRVLQTLTRRAVLQSNRTFVSASRTANIVMRETRPLLVLQQHKQHQQHQHQHARLFSTKTKGDEELSNFLADEIQAEKKARKQAVPPQIDGFEVKTEHSDVTLTRKFNDETITIEFNVNHSVDAGVVEDASQKEQAEVGQMMSKPNFDVIIEKDNQKLLLSCTFAVEPADEQEDYEDLFQIVEFSMFSGDEMDDCDYSVSGDIMDGQLYDLLMNLLEERGITNEFAEQLIEFSTSYEHGQYIGLLEKLKGFVSR